jgi:DNA repair protein RecO (recombination protein O)
MPIEKTEAIVIKTLKYHETSKIATLYTKRFGKISIIAKGIRKTDSKYGGIIETINLISAIFYYKSGKNVHLLKECDIVNSFNDVRSDLNKTAVAYAILELLNYTIVEEEENEKIYNLLVNVINIMSEVKKNVINLYWYFALKLLCELGFTINFSKCVKCNREDLLNKVYFIIDEGGLVCKDCSRTKDTDFDISFETLKILNKLQEIPIHSVCNIIPSARSVMEINEILHRFMRYHIDGFKVPVALKLISN